VVINREHETAMDGQDANKRCFVICPIGTKDSDIRRRSDDIFYGLIEPVCLDFGYKASRVIDDSRPGEITSQIVEAIYKSELVVADITPLDGTPNANVMYELALRHASGKPFIHLSEDVTRLPFDISSLNSIQIRGGFGGVDATRKELADHIRAVAEKNASFDNPVSRFHQKEKVEASSDPNVKIIAKMQDDMSRLMSEISEIKKSKGIGYIERIQNTNKLLDSLSKGERSLNYLKFTDSSWATPE
jgi:hypothetical protein